ncbi:MAG: hypothetical protein LKE46_02045 [Clostridium sp.]|jgi:hypothetical protein|uniref:hypothetical protein n=1 Tax=Clostridium sp. TaxID=1506 RepID=UPI0025BA94F0|nr:hypothetical protein [Clostridium sp.]MCH3963031.1 hypothetical protein [Clostridium sp.]
MPQNKIYKILTVGATICSTVFLILKIKKVLLDSNGVKPNKNQFNVLVTVETTQKSMNTQTPIDQAAQETPAKPVQ